MELKHSLARFLTGGLEKFRDRHKGEACYIFGDGPSIKWFDLKLFSKHSSICCGLLPLHNEFAFLNSKYLLMVEPWVFAPECFQPRSLRPYVSIANWYRDTIYHLSDRDFFVNWSNSPFVRGDNVQYVFRRLPSREERGLAGLIGFNLFGGSFRASLSLAYLLGFSRVYLCGFDAWTIQPARNLHWYEYGPGVPFEPTNFDMKFLDLLRTKMEILTILPEPGSSVNSKAVSYFEHTGRAPLYRENNELVSEANLALLATYPDFKIFKRPSSSEVD